MIYLCACTAQVADSIRKTRDLYRYQLQWQQDPSNDSIVHQTIAPSAIHTYAHFQNCMEIILELEKWDRATLKMPELLRRKQDKEILRD
jgi:hypothetical protein